MRILTYAVCVLAPPAAAAAAAAAVRVSARVIWARCAHIGRLVPSWDPFWIEKFHERVRKEIRDRVQGLAQSDISGIMVSLVLDAGRHPKFFHIDVEGMKHPDLMQEMIVTVASSEGLASAKAFRKSFVAWMIENRRVYPEGVWPKKHAEANRLQALLDGQPDLFI